MCSIFFQHILAKNLRHSVLSVSTQKKYYYILYLESTLQSKYLLNFRPRQVSFVYIWRKRHSNKYLVPSIITLYKDYKTYSKMYIRLPVSLKKVGKFRESTQCIFIQDQIGLYIYFEFCSFQDGRTMAERDGGSSFVVSPRANQLYRLHVSNSFYLLYYKFFK